MRISSALDDKRRPVDPAKNGIAPGTSFHGDGRNGRVDFVCLQAEGFPGPASLDIDSYDSPVSLICHKQPFCQQGFCPIISEPASLGLEITQSWQCAVGWATHGGRSAWRTALPNFHHGQ